MLKVLSTGVGISIAIVLIYAYVRMPDLVRMGVDFR
jgi:hypothetical protein